MSATTKSWALVGGMLAGLAGWATYATADEHAGPAQDPFATSDADPSAGQGQDPFAAPAGAESADPFAAPKATHKPQPTPDADQPKQAERPLQTVFWANGDCEATDRINQALSEPLRSGGLDFEDAPLVEIVDFLRSEYQIEIQLDETALDDLGIGTDEPVTCLIRNVSLMSGLRLMLKQLELTYVIADEVLLITTEEEAETRLTIGIYPTRGVAKDKRELVELAKVIVSTVAAETWSLNGGGEANLQSLDAGFLVISQTRAVHEELIEFLSALRRAKGGGIGSE